nr:hypothetical protein [Natronoglycomyces albus]
MGWVFPVEFPQAMTTEMEVTPLQTGWSNSSCHYRHFSKEALGQVSAVCKDCASPMVERPVMKSNLPVASTGILARELIVQFVPFSRMAHRQSMES